MVKALEGSFIFVDRSLDRKRVVVTGQEIDRGIKELSYIVMTARPCAASIHSP